MDKTPGQFNKGVSFCKKNYCIAKLANGLT